MTTLTARTHPNKSAAEPEAATPDAPVTPAEASDSQAPEAISLDDIDLTGAPALRPMKTLRVHERARVLKECIGLSKKFEDREVNATGDTTELDPEVLDLFAEVDQLMEQWVVDREAYIAWSIQSEGMDDFLRVMALFAKFTERLGG